LTLLKDLIKLKSTQFAIALSNVPKLVADLHNYLQSLDLAGQFEGCLLTDDLQEERSCLQALLALADSENAAFSCNLVKSYDQIKPEHLRTYTCLLVGASQDLDSAAGKLVADIVATNEQVLYSKLKSMLEKEVDNVLHADCLVLLSQKMVLLLLRS
jgi:hypothetical protein